MFWHFEWCDTPSLLYGPNICIDMAPWTLDRLPGTLDGTILSIAVQLYKNVGQGTRGSFRTWVAARSPAALPRAAGLARFLPPQYLQPLETFVGPMWLCGTGPSGDTLH